jgi:hypothetical protein
MTQLTPIQLDEDTVIYVEATDAAQPKGPVLRDAESYSHYDPKTERTAKEVLTPKGGGITQAIKRFKSLEGTIRAYTKYTLNAFRELAVADVDKVKLEFGISVSGEAGIPYITKGEVGSNLKITVECSFPKQS